MSVLTKSEQLKRIEDQSILALQGKCIVNTNAKTIKLHSGQVLGLRLQGKLDFLTNYCGYTYLS